MFPKMEEAFPRCYNSLDEGVFSHSHQSPSKHQSKTHQKDKKPKSCFLRLLDCLVTPGPKEVNELELARYRQKVREQQDYEKERKEKKRKKRQKKKLQERRKRLSAASARKSFHSISSAIAEPSKKLGRQSQSILNLHRKQSTTGSNRSSVSSSHSRSSSSRSVGSRSRTRSGASGFSRRSLSAFELFWKDRTLGGGQAQKDEEEKLRRFFQESAGPSHFSALSKNTEDEMFRQHKELKKRRLSQLYTGDVYHHSISYDWELENANKFWDKLKIEIQKKYPITEKIQLKLDKIREKKERKKKKSLGFFKRRYRGIVHSFQNTSIGYVFRTTPRYLMMSPVTPVHCRRCRHPLSDTLEPRWTAIGISFAILFPIVGLLCCVANREFVCVVCEEIYLYGDYPSRCKPFDKSTLGQEANVKFKKRSFRKASV